MAAASSTGLRRCEERRKLSVDGRGTACLAGLLLAIAPAFAEQPVGDPMAVVYPACRDGYRRQGSFYDFTLGRTWVVLASCGHPEMPRLAVAAGQHPEQESAPATGSGEAVLASPGAKLGKGADPPPPLRAAPPLSRPLVVAGERVRLWRQDGVARLDLAGIALGSGAAGSRVRVRVLASGKVFRGMVRAPGVVELDGADPDGFGAEGQ
jgi:hypothetical protein